MASFGQGERGAAGYEDSGDSEVMTIPPADGEPGSGDGPGIAGRATLVAMAAGLATLVRRAATPARSIPASAAEARRLASRPEIPVVRDSATPVAVVEQAMSLRRRTDRRGRKLAADEPIPGSCSE